MGGGGVGMAGCVGGGGGGVYIYLFFYLVCNKNLVVTVHTIWMNAVIQFFVERIRFEINNVDPK